MLRASVWNPRSDGSNPRQTQIESKIRNLLHKHNPHYCEEVKHHLPHVIAWEAENSDHLFKPYFFDGPVNHLRYLAMLENWFMPQLQSLGIEKNV